MQEEIKFPLVMDDGNIINSQEELKRYLKVKEYIYKENSKLEALGSFEKSGSNYGGYGLNLI